MIFLLVILGFAGAIGALVRFGMTKPFGPLTNRVTPASSPSAQPPSYFERYIPPRTSGQGEAL